MIALSILLGVVAVVYFFRIYSDNLTRKNRNSALRFINLFLFVVFGLVFTLFLGVIANYKEDDGAMIFIPLFLNIPFFMFCIMQFQENIELRKRDKNRVNSSKESPTINNNNDNPANQFMISFTYLDINGNRKDHLIILERKTTNYIEGYRVDGGYEHVFRVHNIMEYHGNSEQIVKEFPLDVERTDNTSIDLISFVKEKEAKALTMALKTAPNQAPISKQVEISFRYEDSEGNITDRRIMLQKKRPPYFSGFCLDRNAKRTFRRDRVLEFYGESKKLYSNFSKSKLRKTTKSKQSKKEKISLQVCFIGFDENNLKLLNALAKAHNMNVMKSITKNLFALVYEGNIDKAREQRALAHGVQLMDKDSFLHFVDTGEINEN